MDTGSLIVVLGGIVVFMGLSLMLRGSRGAQQEPPEDPDEEQEPDISRAD